MRIILKVYDSVCLIAEKAHGIFCLVVEYCSMLLVNYIDERFVLKNAVQPYVIYDSDLEVYLTLQIYVLHSLKVYSIL